ncbi:MAG: SprT family zinc-dependent metalloprotease [Patescibacteria group bacterium]
MEYTLKKTKRSRRISISVKASGEVVVTMPLKAPEALALRFLKEKEPWILQAQARLKKQFEGKTTLKQTRADYLAHKEAARKMITERVLYFNQIYKFPFKDIRIKNQSSRWGSCSAKGNLNFNYGLVKIPQDLADYIVVHELCHLKEMNHGKNFWALVAQVLPHYKELRMRLKRDYIQIS